MSRQFFVAAAGCVAAAVIGFACGRSLVPLGGSCSNDSECLGDDVYCCPGSICCSSPTECSSEAAQSCGSGQLLVNCRCVTTSCLGGQACPDKHFCYNGVCTPPSCVGVDCPSGFHCERGDCVANGCDGKTGEICDGLDNDCDSNTDEGLLRLCDRGCGFASEVCTGGEWFCSARVPEQEICNGEDDDCDGDVDEDLDEDGDGYTVCGGGNRAFADCDDRNPEGAEIHPFAAEACNGVDDDCNGVIDEGFDGDDDGFSTCGTITKPSMAGYGEPPSDARRDCDDSRYDVFPGDHEGPGAGQSWMCNNLDDDCDQIVDEGFDADQDTFRTCDGDCDDRPPNNHDRDPTQPIGCDTCSDSADGTKTCGGCFSYPQRPEVCDGRDNNCNLLKDEDTQCGGGDSGCFAGECYPLPTECLARNCNTSLDCGGCPGSYNVCDTVTHCCVGEVGDPCP